LIYKGTKDGFQSAKFHEKCDDKGATIVLIKSKTNGEVFGGSVSVGWTRDGNYHADTTAFLFSITKKTKLALIATPSTLPSAQ